MAFYAGDGHVCNHCKKKIPIGANVCPYCGNDPDDDYTNQQKAARAYEEALRSAERNARKAKRQTRRAAGIEKHGFLGYYFRKIIIWGIILLILYLIGSNY